jgi:hypothetical protein
VTVNGQVLYSSLSRSPFPKNLKNCPRGLIVFYDNRSHLTAESYTVFPKIIF